MSYEECDEPVKEEFKYKCEAYTFYDVRLKTFEDPTEHFMPKPLDRIREYVNVLLDDH